jgi:hypothetical protein
MKRRHLLSLLLLGAFGVAWAGVPAQVSRRGWTPLVRLAGDGDEAAATLHLQQSLTVFRSLLYGLEIDEQTSTFLSDVRGSLDAFDLSGFHESLPERDGAWRRLRVYGKQKGKRFVVRQGRGVDCRVGPNGALGSTLGDLGVELRAKPVTAPDGNVNYLLRGELGLGVGPVGWNALTASLGEASRLLASGGRGQDSDSQARPSQGTIDRLRSSHPTLRGEDLESLAVLWESFPRVGNVFHSFMRAEDVMVFDPKGDGSYQQLRLAARLRVDLLEDAYPELAEFLEDLGSLAQLQMVWVDPQGRQLARLSFASKSLRLSFSCFVSEGRLLPVDNGVVITAEEPAVLGQPFRFKALVDVSSEINGITTRVHGLEVDWTHTRTREGADLSARITKTPKVTTSGRAFGFIPTWAIDVMIPGNIEELTREFLSTACNGNEGQGMALDVRARQAPGDGPGTLAISSGAELLDNLLVSIAMRIASQRLLPDEDVREDLGKLLARFERAFGEDLQRFAKLSRAGAERR